VCLAPPAYGLAGQFAVLFPGSDPGGLVESRSHTSGRGQPALRAVSDQMPHRHDLWDADRLVGRLCWNIPATIAVHIHGVGFDPSSSNNSKRQAGAVAPCPASLALDCLSDAPVLSLCVSLCDLVRARMTRRPAERRRFRSRWLFCSQGATPDLSQYARAAAALRGFR
jgi:hypothetical protein